MKRIHGAPKVFRIFFNNQILAGKLSGKDLTRGYPRLRPNFNFNSSIGLLTYNEAFSTPPFTGVGLEMYFYCNYNVVSE
jgi:hypothetical protein